MTTGRCNECGAESQKGSGRATIAHAAGCSVGLERQRRCALLTLGEAAEKRTAAERELERCRGVVRARAEACDELGIPRTAIAEYASLSRRRLYTVLDG